MLQLPPLYRQRLRREKAKVIQIKKCDAESVDMLEACMDCTDWNICLDVESCANINEATYAYQ